MMVEMLPHMDQVVEVVDQLVQQQLAKQVVMDIQAWS
jgi:hypothetical protein